MADSSTSNQNHPVGKRGLISKTLDFIFKMIGILILSAIISILMEWIGMAFFYPDKGYQHAELMMTNEVGYLASSLNGDQLNSGMIGAASKKITDIVDFVFIDSGVIDNLAKAKTIHSSDGAIVRHIKSVIDSAYNYIMASIFIIIVLITRFSILVLSTPAFLLFGVVGMCDGLMQRDLRRWCGGNESGFIYHWAKRFSLPVLVATWIIYLSIPMSIHPNYIITPFAALFSSVLMVMSSKFKKYL